MDKKDFETSTEQPVSDVEYGHTSADPSAALQRGLRPRHLYDIHLLKFGILY